MVTMEQFSEKIWDLKYRYRYQGKIIDHTIEDTFARVAKAVACAEKKEIYSHWQQQFYSILEDFKFLPGGRIFAGAGTKHTVTLLNCFVMHIEEDSLSAVFDALKEGALTLQQGGGIGYDFSILRPRGFLAEKTGIPSSGPISFMKIWDAMSAVLLSTGARRGAMMGVLRCDHPDIEEFIAAKSDPTQLRHFNVSVLVSDAFMQAVNQKKEWPLVFQHKTFKKISAQELWQKIIRSAYDYAEPGVLFEDTINRMNNLWYHEHISATNPCGEIPLPAYGACDLGSVNLTQFIESPFSLSAKINWKNLENTVEIATRFQDNVIDISHYPLPSQREQALAARRMGLGFTGLADALVMLQIPYGSQESLMLTTKIMKLIAETTWLTSIELAKEKGIFPVFQKKYCEGKFITTLSDDIQKNVAKYGIRNSHHNAIAPAGTISMMANNISSGLEPIFSGQYSRVIRTLEGETQEFSVKDYALNEWQKQKKAEPFPPAWMDVHSITPQAHIAIQAAVQPYVDNAISKTINIPTNFPFESLSEIYSQAFSSGLKGCTIFRPNPITGSVLKLRTGVIVGKAGLPRLNA